MTVTDVNAVQSLLYREVQNPRTELTTSLKIVFLLSLQQSAEISICILDVQVTYIKIFHGGYDTDTPVISRGGDYLSCTKTRSLVRSQYRLGGLDGDSNLILYL